MSRKMDGSVWTASKIPMEHVNEPGFADYVVKRMVEKIGISIMDLLSNGGEYIVKMEPEQKKEDLQMQSVEIREGFSFNNLIRCKDCEFFHRENLLKLTGWCEQNGIICEEKHFCSYGKRNEQTDAID